MASHIHMVHFYEDDARFVDLVSAWFAEGLRAGEACVVITTPPHRAVLEEKLLQAGLLGDCAKGPPKSYRGAIVSPVDSIVDAEDPLLYGRYGPYF